MADITDPAEEFANVCRALRSSANESGADFLAGKFQTQPWTHEFYQILFAIVERGHYLKEVIENLDGAEHIASQLKTNIDNILSAFRAQSLGGSWKNAAPNYLGENNVGPVMVLSALIRPKISYPSLGPEERNEILQEVATLLGWLEDHQLQDRDFLRQAMIDGLKQFRFRLERVRWLGYGYALCSLKEVIGAYLALHRDYVDDGSMPMVGATLKKVEEGIRTIYQKAGVVKEFVETADFFVKAYGVAAMYVNASTGGIAGLLTFQGGT